ncbi:MAG TPA: nuclear transport factor 2 family protein [Gaiellaceae bacterium]
MQRSEALREAVLRFYDRFSANDVGSFGSIVSVEAMVFIGTAPGEWFTNSDQLRRGFAAEGARIEPGDPQAWEEGTVGLVADEPTLHFPDVGPIRARLTGIFRREDACWKLVSTHLSVGVPDEDVAALQRRGTDGI